MPQPYRGAGQTIFAPEALLERPELAAHIAAIAAAWAGCEEMWGVILGEILQSGAKAGVAMYLSLTGTAAQRNTLEAAAKASATPEVQARLSALLNQAKGPATERNRIVHGRWSTHPENADALVLGEGYWFARANADLHHYRTRRPGEEPDFFPQKEAMKRFVYKRADFEATFARIKVLRIAQNELHGDLIRMRDDSNRFKSIDAAAIAYLSPRK